MVKSTVTSGMTSFFLLHETTAMAITASMKKIFIFEKDDIQSRVFVKLHHLAE
jgi:hypothetical protein